MAGTAPDAFQNSVPLLGEYAGQGQIMPLDDLIAETGYDLSIFDIGVDSWQYTDGQQYGIPLDWAASAIYFNTAMVEDAGLTAEDIRTMTWNPEDGGTFDDIVAHLTIDANGVRGDEPGFDPEGTIKTYGINSLTANDYNGQVTWNSFVSTLGWRLGGEDAAWPTRIPYDDPELVSTLEYIRSLGERGFMPEFGQFTVSGAEQMGSGSVAIVQGGTWDATTITKIPGVEVEVAPTVEGPEGRMMISNSNANNIYAGTPNVDETWAWVTYMGSEACQSTAGAGATFLPSIASSLQATIDAQAEEGLDISSFVQILEDGEIYSARRSRTAADRGHHPADVRGLLHRRAGLGRLHRDGGRVQGDPDPVTGSRAGPTPDPARGSLRCDTPGRIRHERSERAVKTMNGGR